MIEISKINKEMRQTQSVAKPVVLQHDLEITETMVVAYYAGRRAKVKTARVTEIKEDPSVFCSYTRSFSRSSVTIRPLYIIVYSMHIIIYNILQCIVISHIITLL